MPELPTEKELKVSEHIDFSTLSDAIRKEVDEMILAYVKEKAEEDNDVRGL